MYRFGSGNWGTNTLRIANHHHTAPSLSLFNKNDYPNNKYSPSLSSSSVPASQVVTLSVRRVSSSLNNNNNNNNNTNATVKGGINDSSFSSSPYSSQPPPGGTASSDSSTNNSGSSSTSSSNTSWFASNSDSGATAHANTNDASSSAAFNSGYSSSPSSDFAPSTALSWKDKFAHLPIFRKHKMQRNGNDFDTLPPPRIMQKFKFYNRFYYSMPFRSKKLDAFMKVESGQLLSLATSYQHELHKDVIVTLVPLSHSGHPQFYYQVDLLLCQHDSVLMEGRVPFKQAPFSTLVPPRPLPNQIRPADMSETVQSWEPKDLSAYWQPFSWGVRDSPNYTVIHAADCYDYEKLPFLASLRFNMPLIGSFRREVHCLSMIPFLVDNGYKKFAVPWGAAHMPIMHEMLSRNGFSVISVSALPIFDETDGEISQNYVRSLGTMISRQDTRRDILFSIVMFVLSICFIYYNGRIEVDGTEFTTGRAVSVDDGPAPEESSVGRVREDSERRVDMFAKRKWSFEEDMGKTTMDFKGKFGV